MLIYFSINLTTWSMSKKVNFNTFKLMESKSYADSSDVDIFAHISYPTWSIYQFLKKKIVLTSWNAMKALTSETACPRLFYYQKQVLVLVETCAY